MGTTVIGTFEENVVSKVMDALVQAGVPGRDIEVLEGDEDEVVEEIVERGFSEEDAKSYVAALRDGKTLLATRTPEDRVEEAVRIMDRYEAAGASGEEDRGAGRQRARGRGEEERVARVEEELTVNKRQVARGGVRVTSSVHEQPVEETVRLREEQVEVDRRPVDRKLRPEEADAAFEEKTVEMTETEEEVEVEKEARVVEEVALEKQTSEREEKVQDKVRRTEVEVERIEPKSRKGR
ncbi:MAG TPA: DUF2382 domain-containing protein [Geminicoccaceae bacterium]|nr:DUF2382 domain-containing protein [Geminicoccaceae bacterium]